MRHPAPALDGPLVGGPPGLADLDRLLAGESVDERAVERLCDFVDARLDCADFRVLTLLRVAHADNPHVSGGLRERIRSTLLGFRYWMDEAGSDSMCFWSENHQVVFATAEYLAGQRYPDDVFTNPGPGGRRLTGRDRMARAGARLADWYADRLRFGYTEWLSPTYYEEDAAALALMVDLCRDPALTEAARTTLDLLLLDVALHRFDGVLAASAGRAYEQQKLWPESAEITPIADHAFGRAGSRPLERLAGLFLTSSYETPAAIVAVANSRPSAAGETVRQSFGLDVGEVAQRLGSATSERPGLFFWLMEAFTTPESIRVTMDLLRRWRLRDNRFLAPLGSFSRVPAPLLPALVRLLNPATQGVAIQRADVTTWRTPHVQLSSAQRHQPGGFGDQQHLWQATLPGPVPVFATHPGVPMFDDAARNVSPSRWVGNGINPYLGQDGRVLLALWDLRVRGGFLERRRQRHTHLYWPTTRFDESRRGRHAGGGDWLAARCGDGYVGVISTVSLVEGSSPDELVAPGSVTGWTVKVGDAHLDGDFDRFCADLAATVVALDRGRRGHLVVGRHRLDRSGLRADSVPVPAHHPRLDSPWGAAPRFPDRIEVTCGGHTWEASPRGTDAATRASAERGSDVAERALRTAVELCDSLVARQREVAPWMWGPALFGYALGRLDEQLGEPRYREHLLRYARHHLAHPPRIDYSDHVAPALVTFALQQRGYDEFAPLTERAVDYIRTAPRVVDDAVNHLGRSAWNRLYPRSVWVDSLMMFSVFPALHGAATGDRRLVDTAARQPAQYARRMLDPGTDLWHHSYWARAGRPHPRSFWARGNGWVVAALPMILDALPPDHPERGPIVDLLRRTSAALRDRQRPDGTWPTVLGPRPGGYRELSATALISAGWSHAVRAGHLPEEYRGPALRALDAVTRAVERRDGAVHLPEISGPTIPLPVFGRLGYLLVPTGRDHPWGVAAYVLAALEAQDGPA
ncbi:glycoside hydrolase family 88 protein [Tessaracoccus oleiagri]|uniref:Rhamnogalacturonyl hydrolase YesR n=1 Tax=Tessaracoccus oleiagri TaxID=686624 RepID=A0A1G9JCM2_9ACTN|nr:glycoside hydrolase family 88 protein [Tessaracoccus oleiagri]SDL35042.1 Rhamnogalacturonyl hydrolase YesR [Tessaracoccus oleiagri]